MSDDKDGGIYEAFKDGMIAKSDYCLVIDETGTFKMLITPDIEEKDWPEDVKMLVDLLKSLADDSIVPSGPPAGVTVH